MAKITYENKVALNVNSDIADVNKCNATDLNEIKNVVNENDDNTTTNTNNIANNAAKIGTLSNLNTTEKSNLVGAINEVNNNLSRRILIFSGSTSSGSSSKINTTWETIGKFKNLIITIYLSSINSYAAAVIPYELISTGDNLYSGAKNANIYACYHLEGTKAIHQIPKSNITADTITFDNYSGVIEEIYYEN